MTGVRPVLVATNLDDPTADIVIKELHLRGVPVTRFDSADFPADLTLSAHMGTGRRWQGRLGTPTRTVRLEAVRSLYYRRPTGFAFPSLNQQDARFAVLQARYGLGGVLASLPECVYVNHPNRIGDAEYKPAQLAAAIDVGLAVPATLITSDPDAARAFIKERGPVVHKPLAVTPYLVDGALSTVMVEEVDPQDIDDTVGGTAHLFQSRVDKVADMRVTVVGSRVFCARIDSDLLDWRTDFSRLTYAVVEPPSGMEPALHAFLRRFGLVFGAFDFAVGLDGSWTFLECNPSGQWAWLEDHTGLPITGAVADLLQRGST
ncbi:MAG: ATP-grasp ribosomal peptide maturase [Carbonactinosporaceae bacterium]